MLCRQLYQVGPAIGTGFGLAPIPWTELDAWARQTRANPTAFEAECLVMMSRAYSGSYGAAGREENVPPPWEPEREPETDDEVTTRRRTVADKAKMIFGGMKGVVSG